MKNIFYILLLLPTIIFAQYPSNSGHKITLGEQTTADGLLFRGVAATDTVRKPSIDTMAYMVLDTTTNIMWHYKKATSNAWLRVGGSISSGLTGVLPVANGGTNTSTAFTAGSVVFAGSGGTYTQDNSGLFWDNTNKRLGINDNTPNSIMEVRGTIPAGGGGGGLLFVPTVSNDNTTQYGITTQGTGSGASQFILLGLRNGNVTTKASGIWLEPTQPGLNIGNAYTLIAPSNGAAIQGETWIGYTTDQGAFPLQVNGSIYAAGTTYPSDERYKENIIPLNKGLDLINKLKPVTFNYINTTENNFSEFEEVGFIAQDVDRALSTELFVKSIVKYTDESNTDSKMVFSPQNLIPILTKAIQEQNALIKALEQRIINLENK
jgi:hypothetical protein